MKRVMRLANRAGGESSYTRASFRTKKGDKILKREGYTLLYLGYAVLSDARASAEVPVAIMAVKQSPTDQKIVQILTQGEQLYVKEGEQELLTSPLTNISQCSQHTEQGFNDCFGLVFNSGPWIKQCHIFQAKNSKEASDVVLSIHKNVKAVIKTHRRRSEIPISSVLLEPPHNQEGSRIALRRKSDVGLRTINTSEPIPIVQITDMDPTPVTTSVAMKQSPWKRRKEFKELSRVEKMEVVSETGRVLRESNGLLRQSCNNPHPQSPFERALHAINFSSDTLLSYLLDQHMLGIDACDHDGNTLLHYAVAMGKTDSIDILYERMASLEHPGNNKLRPLHRAVIGGNKHVIMALLERGANPNAQDEHRNTPLHYASSSREQTEICWVLLQFAAMILKHNKSGIRPIDLLPDLKEMQNRLIVSMCKSFCDPKERLTTPTTTLPPHADSHYGFSELLDRVKEQAKSLKSKLRKHKAKKISHSISNLSELLEAEEDEMIRQERLEKLKFPIELPRDFLQLEADKDEVEKGLNKLIRMSKSSRSVLKRSTSDPELSASTVGGTSTFDQQQETEFSDNFKKLICQFEHDIPPPRPYTKPHPTLTRQREEPSLTAAFDGLESDLDLETPSLPPKEIIKISPNTSRRQLVLSKPDKSPPQELKSKDEAMALLDDYISQIKSAADELQYIRPLGTKGAEDKSLKLESSSKPPRSTSPLYPPDRRQNYSETIDSSSSSEIRRRQFAVVRELQKRGHNRGGSTGSNLSACSSSSSSYAHQDSLLNFPMDTEPGEPGAQCLRVLVLLSQNPECIQPLISHICLSEFKERLITFASSQASSVSAVSNVACLVHNIFEIGGADGRKTAVESGMMDIVLKLLSTRDPIPGTCLMILNSLLVSDDDNDYLRTIAKIPCDPLLVFLEHSDSDADSGLGSQRERDPSSSSMTTYENHASSLSDELKPQTSHLSTILAKDRAFSLTSESSSAHSAASPTLQGEVVTHVEARRIVLKLLAVSSTHVKMQIALSNLRSIGLLTEYTTDVSLENRTNSVITLANIAQNIGSHQYMQDVGLVDRLRSLLSNGPRPRHQAIRALVYLGKLQLPGCSLFYSSSSGSYETDPTVTAVDGHGHTYARGLTIETSIDLLTSNTRQLWGGIVLRDTALGHHLSREKTVNFYLTTYRSFLHPLIFMRLLLHRLDMPSLDPNPFHWSQDATDIRHTHAHVIPPVHQSVLNVIGQWIETYPEDFRNIPQLQDYVGELAHRLRKFKGVYTPHAHRLRSLLHDLQRPPVQRRTDSMSSSNQATPSDKHRIPHHENLYIQCKQLISEDLLPVTMETAVHLAGLQLHIETLVDNTLNHAFMEGVKTKKESRTYLNHLKHALPAWCFRMKNISKKVREKLSKFEGLSDRNAKHTYISKCQSCPGYHCSFYSIKVPIEGKFRRGHYSQLLGISDYHIVFLEEKTRELVTTYSLQSIQNVHHLQADTCTLVISLITGQRIIFHVERESFARQIVIILDNLGQKVLHDIEKEDLDDWMTTWGQSSTSLQTSAGIQEGTSPSSTGSTAKELEETITPIHREGRDSHEITTPTTLKANGTPKIPLTPLDEVTQSFDKSFTYPEVGGLDEQSPFCDCPPDPEIPLHIDIRLLSLQDILLHPIEVARQVTLIDHEKLRHISREELLQRAGIYPRALLEPPLSSTQSVMSQSTSSVQSISEGIEQFAHRFNQLSNWIIHSILQYTQEEDRGWVIQQFITTAHSCLQYRNYSSTMAIVAGLCSPSIRRLKRTWEHVSKSFKDDLESMTDLLSSRNNYKNYREVIEKTSTPAVPFFGIFTRDLTFILDGNPDYLRNLINLHKRRQIFAKLEEIKRFQGNHYNFEPVHALQDFLTHHVPVNEDDIHVLSHTLEPSTQDPSLGAGPAVDSRIRSTSISSLTNLNIGFLKHSFSSRTSGSSSNLLSI